MERVEQERADDDEGALRQIDRARDPENQREAERNECERTALQ